MDLFSGQMQFDNLPKPTHQHYGITSFLTECQTCGTPMTSGTHCNTCRKQEQERLQAWNGKKG